MSGIGSTDRIDPAGTRRTVTVPGGPLEILDLPGAEPALVLLHEGLGSVGLWRDFPARLAAATGRRVVAYSRHGHGRSGPEAQPRTGAFYPREADVVLPALLDAVGLAEAVLVGHSDGATIALMAAGAAGTGSRFVGVVAMAPHVTVEIPVLATIRQAVAAYDAGDLAVRIARHHDHPDAMFRAWEELWLDPEFVDWDVRDRLPTIACPVLLVQGTADPYGSVEQVDLIAERLTAPYRRWEIDGGGHVPHAEHPEPTLAEVAAFLADSCARPERARDDGAWESGDGRR